MKNYLFCLVVVILGSQGYAQDKESGQTITLKQIDSENKRAVAEANPDTSGIRIGEKFVAVKDGQNCFFTVKSLKDSLVQLDGSNCKFIDRLAVGQTLEASLFDDADASPKPVKVSRRHKEAVEEDEEDQTTRVRVGVAVHYGFGNNFQMNNVQVSGDDTASGNGNINSTGAPGFNIEATQFISKHWGWSAGGSYDFSRTMNTLNINVSGYTSIPYSSPNPTISILTFYGNGIFHLKRWYFPFGFNFTVPNFSQGNSANAMANINGYVGTQIGAGFFITDSLVGEAWIVDQNFTSSNSSNSGFYTNYNTIVLINPELQIKYLF